jgi:hypothetical protein
MPKRATVPPPISAHPIIASAERALQSGVTDIVLLWVDTDGSRRSVAPDTVDDHAVAGLFICAAADIAAGGMQGRE